MRQYFEYEPTQVPTALFKYSKMRKSNKSSLAAILRKGVPFVAEVRGAKTSLWNNTLPMLGKDMEHL